MDSHDHAVPSNPAIPMDGYWDLLSMEELAGGIIRLFDTITSSTSEQFLKELGYCVARGLPKIHIHINSPGGGAYAALAIHDAIVEASNHAEVVAIAEGMAASAAAMVVLQAAPTRLARPHSRFLLHEPRRWVFFAVERTSDLKDEVKEMDALQGVILSILAGRTGKRPEDINAVIERREVWMSATEALQWGLIDEIV